MGATRQPSIPASGTAARLAAMTSSKAVSAVARSEMPRRTPPMSLLCTMSADSTLRTTGKPSAAAASRAVLVWRVGTTGTPAAATAPRAASSFTGPGGNSAGAGPAGRGRRSRKERAKPASAAIARVASSYTSTPAVSRSRV